MILRQARLLTSAIERPTEEQLSEHLWLDKALK